MRRSPPHCFRGCGDAINTRHDRPQMAGAVRSMLGVKGPCGRERQSASPTIRGMLAVELRNQAIIAVVCGFNRSGVQKAAAQPAFSVCDRLPTHCSRCRIESPPAAQPEQQTVAEHAVNFCSSPMRRRGLTSRQSVLVTDLPLTWHGLSGRRGSVDAFAVLESSRWGWNPVQ